MYGCLLDGIEAAWNVHTSVNQLIILQLADLLRWVWKSVFWADDALERLLRKDSQESPGNLEDAVAAVV